ncbi:MAG: YaaR family protein [Treponema sp.]|nr:YaaR family protein [Treponema sp.]
MADIGTLHQTSLYFAAAQTAAQQQAKQAKQQERTAKSARTGFASTLKRQQEALALANEGLPPEIAGMDTEEAVVFLKDAVDIAGDNLKAEQSLAAIEVYRKKLSQLLKYITRNNFEVLKQERRLPFRRRKSGKPAEPFIQIQLINQKLDHLTSDLLCNHSKNLNMLARVEEINGMIIDLLAS